jgi:large repetitive protein
MRREVFLKLKIAVVLTAAFSLSACAGAPATGSPTTANPTGSVPPPSSSTPALFRTEVTVATPGDPGDFVVGDFNDDGNVDVAIANDDNGTVSVLLGSGSGTFDVGANVPGDEGPAAIAAADLNGDGKLEIVVAYSGVSDSGTGADDIVVLLAKGDGSFTRLTRPAGVNAQAIAVGDFDGDKKPDLATADEGDHVSVFLGSGDGTFADPVNSPTAAPFSSGVSVADFNGDGKLDLVTANSLVGRGRSVRSVSVLLGLGDGTFGAPLASDVGGAQPIWPVVGDLNGDGMPDVVTPNGDPSTEVSVLLGTGDGHLGQSIEYQTGADPHSLVLADLDGDGHLDIATWDSGVQGGPVNRGVSVLFGKGDGTFETSISFAIPDEAGVIRAAADLDGDGKLALIFTGSGQLILLFNAIAR